MNKSKIDRLGETCINKLGYRMTIIAYISCLDIDVQFENGCIVKNREYQEFQKRKIRFPEDRTGEIGYNNFGSKMTIIVYRDKDDIDIRFEDGYIIKNMHYCNFKTGKIKNPYEKRVCGIGYVGEGNYKTTIDKKHTKQYDIWRQIISRCYDTQTQIKRPTYIDCTVDERWFNYQNFAKWYDENYYEVDNEVMCLDKDILFKGNKIYSPETCCFVPENINVLFTKRQNCRGECPIGVYFNKRRGKYISQCNINNKNQIHVGAFDDCIDAFNSYKKFKENFIKQTADKYKHKIPQKLYDALYNYQVEITD